jgi:hypothetical protein
MVRSCENSELTYGYDGQFGNFLAALHYRDF